MDLLHKADPWQGKDCGRPQCILCETKQKTEKHMNQDCTKRCIIYETWCLSCEEKEVRRLEEDTEDEKEQKEKIKNIKLHKCIGESSRSLYDRGIEHQNDRDGQKTDSHMIKHYCDQHSDEELSEMRF